MVKLRRIHEEVETRTTKIQFIANTLEKKFFQGAQRYCGYEIDDAIGGGAVMDLELQFFWTVMSSDSLPRITQAVEKYHKFLKDDWEIYPATWDMISKFNKPKDTSFVIFSVDVSNRNIDSFYDQLKKDNNSDKFDL